MSAPGFPTMLELPRPVPRAAWRAGRAAMLAAAVGAAVALVADPGTGTKWLWGLVVPLLPLVWLVAPGIWRNVCPAAALNQVPRTLGFGGGHALPQGLRTHAPLIAALAFVALVASRRPELNGSGPAAAALILAWLGLAFAGGVLFRGKSGWCSTFCPLLPVQRVYGQAPYATVANDHCRPCVGCVRNCYDFNPRAAWLADLSDSDRRLGGYRRLFAGALPGVVLAYYTAPGPGEIGTAGYYGRFALAVGASAASLFLLELVLDVSAAMLTAVYGAVAFVLFYWHAAPVVSDTVLGAREPPVTWTIRLLALALVVPWLVRAWRQEAEYLDRAEADDAAPIAVGGAGLAAARAARADAPEVTFEPSGVRVVARPGATLLEVAERSDHPLEAGCRLGVCGSDPVCVKEGMRNLSPPSDEERTTIERLGLAASTRMACCARVNGPVTVALSPERAKRGARTPVDFDPRVERVVVVGNGVAGVTAADHIRRRHPDCSIDVVAAEPYQLYNRMGISRLVHGRTAMVGLQLLPDAWYEDHRVTTWLNTHALEIDRDASQVLLGTGERLRYDRLILAPGSEAAVPPIDGFGAGGTFVLRRAGDAMGIRAWAQHSRARNAVVAGGGLLGLEAAYALKKLGLSVTVLERSDRLLRRQLDEHGAAILEGYLAGLGIDVLTSARVERIHGDEQVEGVELANGTVVPADVVLAAAGITPNTDLAVRAGIEVRRGIVVDDRMRTSDPRVFAAGDAAEHRGDVAGLWPAAVEQAEVAAHNAVGAAASERRYEGSVPVTILKVEGVELLSCGRFEAGDGAVALVVDESDAHRYRKLVVDAGGTLIGGIVIGSPPDAGALTDAVKEGRNVEAIVDRLQSGDWSRLARHG